MDRELILATLAFVLCGCALLAGGLVPRRRSAAGGPDALERTAWRRMWLPLAPAAAVLAFLLGWALQEPEASEPAGPILIGVRSGSPRSGSGQAFAPCARCGYDRPRSPRPTGCGGRA